MFKEAGSLPVPADSLLDGPLQSARSPDVVFGVRPEDIELASADDTRPGLLLHGGSEVSWLADGVLAAPWWRVL